jgi:hypothetical protein
MGLVHGAIIPARDRTTNYVRGNRQPAPVVAIIAPVPAAALSARPQQEEISMRDMTTVIKGYFDVWNEANPAERRNLIGRIWAEDARYVDPLLAAEGPEGIDAMVAGVQQQLPGHRFRLAGAIDSHHDRVRFAWELIGPNGGAPVYAGVDFGTLAADGRLSSVTGFLDRAPAA